MYDLGAHWLGMINRFIKITIQFKCIRTDSVQNFSFRLKILIPNLSTAMLSEDTVQSTNRVPLFQSSVVLLNNQPHESCSLHKIMNQLTTGLKTN
jgi:hypothetical protein